VPRDTGGTEITSAYRRYQFDIQTELMIAARARAATLGVTFRVYLENLVKADIQEHGKHAKKK
jgi:hypothetical protein